MERRLKSCEHELLLHKTQLYFPSPTMVKPEPLVTPTSRDPNTSAFSFTYQHAGTYEHTQLEITFKN